MSFAQLISRRPAGAELMHRIEEVLQPQPLRKTEYSLDRICELVEPRSRDELILALGKLVQGGQMKKIVRVISHATQGGVADFNSLEEVPRVINDGRTGLSMEVTPDDLRLIYVVPALNDNR